MEYAFLFGLGLGLYWGEGNKRNKNSVRLGNIDPDLIIIFMQFLQKVFNVRKEKFKFGLQIFNDIDPSMALSFWQKKLSVSPTQFQKVVVTKKRGKGTYRYKAEHGVLTIYVNNKKLRDEIFNRIENLRKL